MNETSYERGYRLAREGAELSPFQECLVSANAQGGPTAFASGYIDGVRENLHEDIAELEHQ